MSLRHRIARNFGRAAQSYNAHANVQQQALDQLVALLAPQLSSNARVLDVGCGTGTLSAYAREHGLDWNILNLDLSEAMCKHAKMHSANVLCADATALPFADGSVDAVCSNFTLQWCADSNALFQELARVLKPSGLLAFTVPGPATMQELKMIFASAGQPDAINPQKNLQSWNAALAANQFKNLTEKSACVAVEYKSAGALLEELKETGAHTPLAADFSRTSLSVLKQIRGLSPHIATWEILTFCSLKK